MTVRRVSRTRRDEQCGAAQSVACLAEAGFVNRRFRLGDETVARRNAWRQTFIDLLAAILRGRRLNSRTIAKRSPPEAAKATLLSLTSISFRASLRPRNQWRNPIPTLVGVLRPAAERFHRRQGALA
jgi:hypothetical protein